MSKNLRVKTSKFIDETYKVSFRFNGKTYYGFKGDTLASALLANDIHLVGRSFNTFLIFFEILIVIIISDVLSAYAAGNFCNSNSHVRNPQSHP